MSFSVTFFGPKHYWWGSWRKRNDCGVPRKVPRYWYYKPSEHSTGGVGFCIPGLHVVFYWGRK